MLKLAKCFVAAAAVLAAGRVWGQTETELAGKITGGKVEADKTLRVKANKTATLEGVTLAGTVVVENRGELRISGALTLEGGKILLASGAETSFETVLSLAKGASIMGNGTIEFRGGKTRNRVVSSENKGEAVFGNDVVLQGAGGGAQFRSLADAPMRFDGMVIAGPGDEAMRFEGPMTISGRLRLQPGAETAILELTNLSAGVLTGGGFWLKDATLRVRETIETNAAALFLENTKVLIGDKGAENVLPLLKKNAANGDISITGSQKFAGKFLNEGGMRIHGLVETETLINKGTLRIMDKGVKGRLENSGTLQVWNMSMQGDLVLENTGTLITRIFGEFGGGSGIVRVDSGKITAGGTLHVTSDDGYMPPTGKKFEIIYGKIEGKFTQFVLPKLAPNQGWNIDHLYDQGILEVVAGTGNAVDEAPKSVPGKSEPAPVVAKVEEKKGQSWWTYVIGGVIGGVVAILVWRSKKKAAK
jgi:hypothetical protein